MRINAPKLLLAIVAAGLAGCAAKPGGESVRAPMVQQVSNAQEIEDVVSLLNNGDEKAARKKLDAMLKRDPADTASAALMESITADPMTALGSTAFTYRVEAGDTMQGIAKRFLGDARKFYLLSRYNQLTVPASLKPGQTIRVPGTRPKEAPAPARPRATPAPATKAPPAPAAPAATPHTADPRRAAQLRSAGLTALNKGQIGTAVGLLSQAQRLDPGNALIQRDLDRARRLQATVRARR